METIGGEYNLGTWAERTLGVVLRSTTRKAAYCGGELSWLSSLPALLTNGRQWGVHGGDIICGEAAMEVRRADGVIRRSAHLGATGDGCERGLWGVSGRLESITVSNA